MLPIIQQTLSRVVLKTLINTGKGLDYTKAIGGVTGAFKSVLGGTANEVQIPLPQAEKPRFKPDDLTDVQIEAALAPLFDYLDANMPTLNTYLSDSSKDKIMNRIWKEILNTIEGLLIPPLSDAPSELKPLTDKEVDIAFKWLKVSNVECIRLFFLLLTSFASVSSFVITSTLVAKGLYQSRICRIKSSAM
jgi:hypothetical protein